MKDRWWIGLAVLGVFVVGFASGWRRAPTREVVVEKKASGETIDRKVDELAREVFALADETNTGTEVIEHHERRAPDGGVVEATTKTHRTFALRSYQREQEREQTKTVTEYVDRWNVVEKVKLVERLHEPQWGIALLGGANIDARTPVAAVQVKGHVAGPFNLVLQVQRTFAGGPLDGWVALAGVEFTW